MNSLQSNYSNIDYDKKHKNKTKMNDATSFHKHN